MWKYIVKRILMLIPGYACNDFCCVFYHGSV